MGNPEFVKRFNAVEIPASERAIDDASGTWEATQQNYFDRITASFHLGDRALTNLFEIKTRMLVPLDMTRASDDFLTELWVSGRQPIATTLRERTESNHQIILFNKYPLSQGTVFTIKKFKHETN